MLWICNSVNRTVQCLNVWCSLFTVQCMVFKIYRFIRNAISLNEFTIPVAINLRNDVKKKLEKKSHIICINTSFVVVAHAMCLLTSLKSQILCLNRIIVRPMSLINITEFIYLFSTSRLVPFILSTLYICRDEMAEWRSLKCSKCFFNQNFCNPFLYMQRKTHLKKPILDKLVNNESSEWKVFADFRNS